MSDAQDALEKAARKSAKEGFNSFWDSAHSALLGRAAETSTPFDDMGVRLIFNDENRRAVWKYIKGNL